MVAEYYESTTPVRSSFLQNLREVLYEYGQKTDIMSCLTLMNKRMAEQYEASYPKIGSSQPMVVVKSMLTKQLIFTPAPQVGTIEKFQGHACRKYRRKLMEC